MTASRLGCGQIDERLPNAAAGHPSRGAALENDGIPSDRRTRLENQAGLLALQHQARLVKTPKRHALWRGNRVVNDRLPSIVVGPVADLRDLASRITNFSWLVRHSQS